MYTVLIEHYTLVDNLFRFTFMLRKKYVFVSVNRYHCTERETKT